MFDVKEFMKISHLRILYVFVPLILFYALFPSGSSTGSHIIGLVLSEVIVLVSIYLVGLDMEERKKVISVAKRVTKRNRIR